MKRIDHSAEQLSALMDGELTADELDQLLSQVGKSSTLRQQWVNHHLIRRLIRTPVFQKSPQPQSSSVADSGFSDRGFADRVAAAVEQEPTILAPRSEARNRRQRRNPWVPLALAASLGVVSFLLIQQSGVQQQQPIQLAGKSDVDKSDINKGNVNGVTTEWVEVDGEWVERWVNPLTQSPHVRSYLVRHNENRRSARQRAALVSTAPTLREDGGGQPVTKRIIGWKLMWLPDGFRKVDSLQHEIPAFGGAVNHLVLSNGEEVFSVFIDKPEFGGGTDITERQMESQGQSINLYSHSRMGHRITVLGEVPMEMVKQVALSVEAESG